VQGTNVEKRKKKTRGKPRILFERRRAGSRSQTGDALKLPAHVGLTRNARGIVRGQGGNHGVRSFFREPMMTSALLKNLIGRACASPDYDPVITFWYQARISSPLTLRQTVMFGFALVEGRKSATVIPRVAVPVVSTVTGSRFTSKRSGWTA
jgi:hypothetical protein